MNLWPPTQPTYMNLCKPPCEERERYGVVSKRQRNLWAAGWKDAVSPMIASHSTSCKGRSTPLCGKTPGNRLVASAKLRTLCVT